jgi:hypothetical protein
VHRHERAAALVAVDGRRKVLTVGAGELGRRMHPGPREHLLHETGSLEIDPRVVVGSPSNNLKVSVTDSQVL